LEPAPVCLSFKCSQEDFGELTERPGVVPAPYLARAQWVALETRDAIGRDELAGLLGKSYELVLARLPKRLQRATSAISTRSKAGKPGKPTKDRKNRAGARRRS